MQFLQGSTSKSVPTPSRLNHFELQIALAPQRGIAWRKFCDAQLPKVFGTHGVLTILTSKSLSRHNVVQTLPTFWAADPPHHLAFGSSLCECSRPRNDKKHDISRNSCPPKHIQSRMCAAQTCLLSNIDAARPTRNLQHGRKLNP